MNMPVFCPPSGSTSSAMPSSRTGTVAREAPRATREPRREALQLRVGGGGSSKIVFTPSSASSASKISARRPDMPSVVICTTAASP